MVPSLSISLETACSIPRKPLRRAPDLAALLAAALLAGCGGGSSDSDTAAVLQDDTAELPATDEPAINLPPADVPVLDVPEFIPDPAEVPVQEPVADDPVVVDESVDTVTPTDTAPPTNVVEDTSITDDVAVNDEIVEDLVEDAVATVAPDAPTSPGQVLSIEYSGYDLEIFWTRSTDEEGFVLGYDIYRNDELLVTMLDALSYYDASVQPDTRYTYEVYAVDEDGLRSAPGTLQLTTPSPQPPGETGSNFATLTGGGSSSWNIADGVGTSNSMPSGGACISNNGAGSGVAISDANIPGQYDAFDFASMMWVNGEQVGGWLRSASASTTNFAPVPLAGLQVRAEFHAISTQATLRNYTSFTNESPDDITVIINVASNFGADSSNYVAESSDGDLVFDADDRWVITDDYSNGGDPTNTTVFFGPDSPVSNSEFVTSSVFNCAGSEGLSARIDLTVPAGERRALMFFHSMSANGDLASAAARQFDITPTIDSDLAEGLSEQQLLEVANW